MVESTRIVCIQFRAMQRLSKVAEGAGRSRCSAEGGFERSNCAMFELLQWEQKAARLQMGTVFVGKNDSCGRWVKIIWVEFLSQFFDKILISKIFIQNTTLFRKLTTTR
jgi:hypothetical protein